MAFAFVRSRIFSSKIFSPVARSLAKPKYEQCMNDLFYTYLFLTTDFYRQLWTNQGPWNYYNDYIIHRKCSWHLYSWTGVFSFIPGKNNLSRWTCIRSTCIIPIPSACTYYEMQNSKFVSYGSVDLTLFLFKPSVRDGSIRTQIF